MHLQDHDIVVEDEGILFRACVTAAALDVLGRRGAREQPAEALIADNRAGLERIAIAAFRAGDAGEPTPVIIGANEVAALASPVPGTF